jgi:ABC-type amino acid transport substrate-binding protein
MKRVKIGKIVTLALALLMALQLAGCGGGANTSSAASSTASGAEGDSAAREIRLAIGNAYNPFCYLNENDELTGYEYEVLKRVDDLLPQYTFKYEPTEFSNILVGIDTGSFDMGVHGFSWNPERAEKYLYSTTPSATSGGYVIISAAGKDIQGLEDMAGKKIQVKTGNNVANLLETYNQENPDKAVEIVYEDSENEQIVSNLVNGVYDGYINEKIDADQWLKQFAGLAEYGEKLFENSSDVGYYYLYNKTETQLEQDISAALTQLHAEGVTAEISVEYLGADYTK